MISNTSRDRVIHELLPKPEKHAHKVVHSMAGIPGAGKSTFVEQAIARAQFPESAFILNPDRVMRLLPEYHESVEAHGAEKAFEMWEMPSRVLAYELVEIAGDSGVPIIKDMACARQENFDILQRLKSRGYTLHFYYIYCELDTAMDRARQRKRHAPEAMIRSRHKALQDLLPEFITLSDYFEAFDNTCLNAPFRNITEEVVQPVAVAS